MNQIVIQLFHQVRGIPRQKLAGEKFRKVQEERKLHLSEVTAFLQKEEANRSLLKAEVLSRIRGESDFFKEMLAEMIADKKECAAWEKIQIGSAGCGGKRSGAHRLHQVPI